MHPRPPDDRRPAESEVHRRGGTCTAWWPAAACPRAKGSRAGSSASWSRARSRRAATCWKRRGKRTRSCFHGPVRTAGGAVAGKPARPRVRCGPRRAVCSSTASSAASLSFNPSPLAATKKGCSPLFWRAALEISVPDLFYLSRHVYRMARSPDGAVVPPDHFPHRPQDILARATYIGKAEAQPAVTEIRLYAPGIPDISHIIHFVSADLPCLHPRLVIFALMLHAGFPQADFRVRSRVGLPASYAMFHNLHIQFFLKNKIRRNFLVFIII